MNLIVAVLAILPHVQNPPAVPHLTDREISEFARAIDEGISQGKASSLDERMDFGAFVDIAIKGLALKDDETRGFRAGISESFQLGKELLPASGKSYRFVGLHSLEGHRCAIFRVWSETGLNYHALRLHKTGAGEIRIVDLFIYINGDWMTSLFRRAALSIIIKDPVRGAKLNPREIEQAKHLMETQEIQQLVRAGKHAQALEVYAKLPEEVRKDRLVQLFRVMAASQSGEAEYLKAEEEFKKLYPEDFSRDLVSLDGFFYRKQFDKAHQALDKIDKSVGGDPFLHFMRGSAFVLMEEFPEAKAAGLKAVKEVPYLAEPRWLLVTVSLRQKDHAETAKLLVGLEKDLKLVMGDLETIPDYADFVKSPEYREWKARK